MDSNWKSLPNYFGEKSTKKNWLAVVDNSGSMTMGNGQAMNVALSLGIYIAERNTGIFKNQMITFSAIPHFLTPNDAWNITEKVNYILLLIGLLLCAGLVFGCADPDAKIKIVKGVYGSGKDYLMLSAALAVTLGGAV